MIATGPVNRYLRVVPLRVSPGHRPPSGPAIQRGKKLLCVIGERPLGRSATRITRNALHSRIAASAQAQTSAPAPVRSAACARPAERLRKLPAQRSRTGARRRGSVLASLDMNEGPPERALEG